MRIDFISTQINFPGADEKLINSCRDFEGVFISILLKNMRHTVVKGGLFGKDPASEIYTEMLDTNYAGEMASSGGIGLAAVVYDRLKDYLKPADKNQNGGVEDAAG